MDKFFVHESSYVDEDVVIGQNTKVWHFCHIQKGQESEITVPLAKT